VTTAAGDAGPTGVPAVDAATVVLVRDRPVRHGHRDEPRDAGRLETLLLERHIESDFAGGAFVFPGGKVDDTDRHLDGARWVGRPLSEWRGPLGVAEDADALGLLVAAVRETFEEAGVLLAFREDGTPLDADDLTRPSFVTARQRLAERGRPWDWRGWLEDEALTLDLAALALWSWWVTPVTSPKRFDTRFFVARLPAGQVARHDTVETTAVRWMRPADALAEQARGDVVVIFPTRHNLTALAAFTTAEAAWHAAAAGEVDQRRVQPTLVEVAGRAMVQHPFGGAPEPL
jgi:8-oxo-dGTP pyrophosphatase MutT (NUDIX family)